MAPKNSRHYLPMNSMLFNSQTSLRSSSLAINQDPALANLHEAQDITITALPQPVAKQLPTTVKKVTWRRVLRKIKTIFRHKRSVSIGSPTKFRHLVTGGVEPLRTAPPRAVVVSGAKRGAEKVDVEKDGDSDWEDVD
ncbi:uncharacterized protein K460DRAFT_399914 [Cucurbitaria berberidis CBS 394.84]|uniref:Uncharacterized protein n=1 Tax=Cucurbitaria berberidis CBS 394.84 TaxID=1168544 RepID=A0A9P4GR64_9PLEO|nr:uncharacterized protein K460DRAFT_399914 [Cucurbitaria berberidis CBS 394.84]KAF1849804.1 hypothetical protein K460DRAFT_399914 [Cucurbitaria berberidis CBS 394.84]